MNKVVTMKIQIDFKGGAKLFDSDYGIKTTDFYSLEILPFLGKKGLPSFELLFSNLVSGQVTWDVSGIDKNLDSSFGKLAIAGEFKQDIDCSQLHEALTSPLTADALEFKSTTIYILTDADAENEWDRTKGLSLKESGSFQKIKIKITL
jgi:hypothetical protein